MFIFRGREDFWHSTAIAEAKTAKVVVTVSGSVYKLKGKINKLCTIDNGMTTVCLVCVFVSNIHLLRVRECKKFLFVFTIVDIFLFF